MRIILLNKPFRVLPQFTSPDGRPCLRDHLPLRGVYPAGRLDFDSEGLLILTDFGPWQARISQPGSGFAKRYCVQVEHRVAETALERLRAGVTLADGLDPPCPLSPDRGSRVAVAARSADPPAGGDPDRLAGTRDRGRSQPTGPAHDRRGRSPDAAPDPGRGRTLDAGRTRPRRLAQRAAGRGGAGAGRRPPQPRRACPAIRIASSRACS